MQILIAKNLILLIQNIKVFLLLVVATVAVESLYSYFTQTLVARWRDWFTTKFFDRYLFEQKNYLELSRKQTLIKNPGQRIQEDIHSFVKKTIEFSLGLFSSLLNLGAFISSLWILGGTLTFIAFGTTIIIPGYLVWVSLGVAVVSSAVTRIVGYRLGDLNNKQAGLEADFRKSIEIVEEEAENIALEHSEKYYKKSASSKFQSIIQNSYKIITKNTLVLTFQNIFGYIPTVLPWITAGPLYFAGKIGIEHFTQIGASFSEVNNALSWFVNTYIALSQYKANLTRIVELEKALDNTTSKSEQKAIQITPTAEHKIEVKNLDITSPIDSTLIIHNLSFTFTAGESVLIKGNSGLGKSTLIKAIAAIWPYGKGEISTPAGQNIQFLPQKPVLPAAETLKAILSYPDDVTTYTQQEYESALRDVNLSQFIKELPVVKEWRKQLSLGEQQRISFARALLKKPSWLFLDEATASLDVTNEEYLYSLLRTKLPKTTIISIAHRDVSRFHDSIITLSKSETGQTQITKSTPTPTVTSVFKTVLHSATVTTDSDKTPAEIMVPLTWPADSMQAHYTC